MNAMKNLLHAAILAVWAVLGVLFTIKAVFGAGPVMPHLMEAGSWWLWFAGLAAVTSLLVARFDKAFGALLVHSGVFIVLSLLPKVLPFAVFRLGIDLLARA